MRILIDTQVVIKIIYDENDIDASLKLAIATTDVKFKYYPDLKIIDVSK